MHSELHTSIFGEKKTFLTNITYNVLNKNKIGAVCLSLLWICPHLFCLTAAVLPQARQVIVEEAAGGQPALSDQTAVDGIFLCLCTQNNLLTSNTIFKAETDGSQLHCSAKIQCMTVKLTFCRVYHYHT